MLQGASIRQATFIIDRRGRQYLNHSPCFPFFLSRSIPIRKSLIHWKDGGLQAGCWLQGASSYSRRPKSSIFLVLCENFRHFTPPLVRRIYLSPSVVGTHNCEKSLWVLLPSPLVLAYLTVLFSKWKIPLKSFFEWPKCNAPYWLRWAFSKMSSMDSITISARILGWRWTRVFFYMFH